ncbi:hypothetical protein H7J07_04870 [Mycobacterium koreense]|uniref:Uncharacterized protein n=1 Tax=Mycolicibacillus koreensis TaxID=1069220 RepID=A0A7I7SAY9_9MYCO|nr:hypothetical protein [Mycolicibacillus koreensis]MCV7247590.1 hypothetical protein [Mycolicibacillus koreensis]OSC32832.1 hypothetical protein B8W67_14030 [Mycolicibacillus koreensis]BBY53968.1 hypothetical protein MKOR_12190 [Mycolicibacillus koreensis]
MSVGICAACFVLGLLVHEVLSSWDDPAFRWGFTHPFGPPRPWWPRERRTRYFIEHGAAWRKRPHRGERGV